MPDREVDLQRRKDAEAAARRVKVSDRDVLRAVLLTHMLDSCLVGIQAQGGEVRGDIRHALEASMVKYLVNLDDLSRARVARRVNREGLDLLLSVPADTVVLLTAALCLAVVKMVDEGLFPGGEAVAMCALTIAHEALHDEGAGWGRVRALREMAGVVLGKILATGYYPGTPVVV